MKMTYLPNKERGTKKIFTNLAIFVFLATGVYFWITPISNLLRTAGIFVSAPFWSAQNYVTDKIASILINANDKQELVEKNKYLTNQVNLYKYLSLENNIIRDENSQLKKLLSRTETESGAEMFTKKTSDKKLLAYVLSGPVSPPYDNLIVDAGESMGVSEGDLVVGVDGYIMGTVVEVYTNQSKIRLFSSYGLKTSVYLGENTTMIETTGMGSGNFYIAMPKEFIVEEDDLAIYPGPAFYPMASVSRIEGKEGEMFKNIFLRVPYNIKQTRVVGIIKNKTQI